MQVDMVLRKCRRIVAAFSQRWKRSNELSKVQEQNDTSIHKLKGDVSTRWGLTAVMVKRILEQKEAIRIVLSSDRATSHLAITWQDIDLLTSIESFLSPLEDLADTLSSETHVTISVVKPLLEHLSTDLLSPNDGDTELTKQMKQRCKAKILQQYEGDGITDVKRLLDIATFLDPHFKHCKDNEEKKKEIEELVKIEMLKASECEYDNTNHVVDVRDKEGSSEIDIPTPKGSKLCKFLGRKYGLGTLQSDGSTNGSGMSPLEKAKNEMTMYLQYPQLDIADCPLGWWKKEAVHLPMLSTLAKKFLCICATSVSSERVFSTGGNIVTSKRNSLEPHVVDQLIFLAKNLD